MKTIAVIWRAQFVFCLAACAGGIAAAQTSAPAPAPPPTGLSAGVPAAAPTGEIIPELQAGKTVYYDVHVTEVTPQAILIRHRGGLASVPLADLSPDWQKHFNYDPAKAAADIARQQAELDARRARTVTAVTGAGAALNAADQIRQQLQQPPNVLPQVNLRARYAALGIEAQNPAPRLSSAVFTVVNALEFQQSPVNGPAPTYSEEYLIWATLTSMKQSGIKFPKQATFGFDIGFSLEDVLGALHDYGVALQSDLPYHITVSDPKIMTPADDVVAAAKLRLTVTGLYSTGEDAKSRIAGMVHVLNAGLPVLASMNWPDEKLVQTNAVLGDQPGRDKVEHAVLVVGYRCETGKLEDVEFLFENSYGTQWGGGGCGLATYRYLAKNLQSAWFFDAHASEAAAH